MDEQLLPGQPTPTMMSSSADDKSRVNRDSTDVGVSANADAAALGEGGCCARIVGLARDDLIGYFQEYPCCRPRTPPAEAAAAVGVVVAAAQGSDVAIFTKVALALGRIVVSEKEVLILLVSESGMQWTSGGAKRHCGRALGGLRVLCAGRGAARGGGRR